MYINVCIWICVSKIVSLYRKYRHISFDTLNWQFPFLLNCLTLFFFHYFITVSPHSVLSPLIDCFVCDLFFFCVQWNSISFALHMRERQ